ncbi:hypothetical protein Rxyl_1462 [Rubrobacter xylanophilus DSM 9941]|uniref:Uncharacterized protein n=1 Tax=Rubrobacter xylanophilus (strain DSM 9941 / JCM 11954 / NBRC 16129 / PRD-1) TaxID=266117 RepID=Q1AW04_RUBXD|nr:hypothetical protein [Rubrobacter xylanophilus]ABG04424.1 hypothetical protein Rxyl_1462 [Rubrobacter xylanophilus DSM 9941]
MAGRDLREGAGRVLLDALVRDNRVLPPVLAVVAVFLFAWAAAGSLLGGGERVASRQGEPAGEAPPPAAPVEAPDVDSYAAYQSKDPFRQLLQRSEATSGPEETTAGQRGFERTGTAAPPPERTSPGGAGFGREDATRRPARQQRPSPPRERTRGLFQSGGNLPPPGRVADGARVP